MGLIGVILMIVGIFMILSMIIDMDLLPISTIGMAVFIIGLVMVVLESDNKTIPPSISITKESLIKTGNATYSTTSGVFILRDGLVEVK